MTDTMDRFWQTAMLGTLLALGGCGPDASDSAPVEAPSAGPGFPEPRPSAAPPSASPPSASTIPERFHGKWSLGDSRCAAEFSEEYLVIKPTVLEFWESRGAVVRVRAKASDSLELDLAFEGEGQNWQAVESLTLIDADTKLTRTGGDDDAAAIYWRCRQ